MPMFSMVTPAPSGTRSTLIFRLSNPPNPEKKTITPPRMKMSTHSLLLAATLAFAPLFSVMAAEPNTLTSAESAAGWKLLFDGKTLNGWRGFATDGTPTNWKVEDGALVWTARGGDLVTKEVYGDFELSLEWKVA